jgi:multidrug efflux system membrane fusion protein
VDPDNRTIHLRATFANQDRRLWPGQYVKVLLTVARESNSILVPSQAVQTSQDNQFVYVVKADQTVEARTVTAKRTVGKETVVEGVSRAETVVTDATSAWFQGAGKSNRARSPPNNNRLRIADFGLRLEEGVQRKSAIQRII